MLSTVPERDVCLFHECDNDQRAYPCPSPMLDRDDDDLKDLKVLPCQAWFDTEAPEAFDRDNFDTIATTVQHLRMLARSEVRIESLREISVNSKFANTSVGTQKYEGVFTVRNVTKPTAATAQLTDEGREARPSEADGQVWSVKSAERIMRLLRSKRSFSELKDQKGEYVTLATNSCVSKSQVKRDRWTEVRSKSERRGE